MISRVSSILVALVLISIIVGCSKAPTVQYDSGVTALEQARVAEAEMYAPEAFKAASDTLNAAMVEIQKQDGRFSMLRDYDQAESYIAAAKQLAEKALADAATEKERVRVQDSALVVEITTLIKETRSAIASAPRGKGSRVDIKMMQAELDAAEAAIKLETAELEKGNYLAAWERLTATKSQIEKIKTDIAAAVASLNKK